MSKELFISSSPHETKVAVLEDDQLVEVYYERDTDVGLVGGIYKGRVSRVLPGMQSAFVDIGLERDAFLYVSDFFEDAEEYDKVVAEAEARVTRLTETPSPTPVASPVAPVEQEPPRAEAAGSSGETVVEAAQTTDAPPVTKEAMGVPVSPVEPQVERASAPAMPVSSSEVAPAGPPPAREKPEFRPFDHRGRRNRHRGRGFGGNRFEPRHETRDRAPDRQDFGAPHTFEILPGESLAKYKDARAGVAPQIPSMEAPCEASAAAPPPSPTVGQTEVNSVEPGPAEAPPIEPPTFPAETPENEAAPQENLSLEAPLTGTVAAREGEVGPPVTPPEVEKSMEPKPRPLWNRFVSTVFGEAPHPLETEGAGVEKSDQEAAQVPPSEAAPAVEIRTKSPASHEATSEAEMENGQPAEPSDTASLAAEPAVDSGSQAPPSAPEQPTDSSAGPVAREYTLREPHQRGRFAPRRGRRGRQRGQRGYRPQGNQNRRNEPSRAGNNQQAQIAELLKEGQEILVQIAKEPLGRKGARITSHIALPGRYLVYMPTVDHIGVSRKIASEEERLRLRNIILESKGALTGGFIVRTACAGRSDDEIKADVEFLSRTWTDIRTKSEQSKAPALLHRDLDLAHRLLRDLLSPDFKSIRVDSETDYAQAVEFVNRCQPALVGRVKLYTRDTPLFEEFGIQAEIDKALKSKVWIKSGGYIVINQTEALVAIDVNTGKYVGKTNRLEDTIVKTNIDSVKEIVRQIRLRDLGGIIVIDFIDMDERRNRNKVVQALEEALRFDRAPTKILSFNDFGLVAITRKRVKQSLERTLSEPCGYCSGSGWIKSVTTVCYEILSEARKMAKDIEGSSMTLRVNPDVARALKSRDGLILSELESITHKDVIVKSDPPVHQERFEIY